MSLVCDQTFSCHVILTKAVVTWHSLLCCDQCFYSAERVVLEKLPPFGAVWYFFVTRLSKNIIRLSKVVVARAFNPSTWEAEAGRSLSLRPAWSTEQVLGQREILFGKTRPNQTKPNQTKLTFTHTKKNLHSIVEVG